MRRLFLAIGIVVTLLATAAFTIAVWLSYAGILDGSATTSSLAGLTWFLAILAVFGTVVAWTFLPIKEK